MKLDLGDTYHGRGAKLKRGWIAIALDDTDKLVGDYNKMPFPNNTFEYAYGGCYLEETVDFRELYRVLKPGARANLFGCGELFADYQVVEMMARAAGFKISRHLKFDHEDDHVSEMCQPYHEASSRQDPGNYSTYKPMIIYKPKEATQ